MGYRTYVPVLASIAVTGLTGSKENGTVESPFFKATLDAEHGTIRSLVAKPTGRELVEASAPHGFGQYLYERFDSNRVQSFVDSYVKISADWATNELGKPNLPPSRAVPYEALSPTRFNLRIEESSIGVTAVMSSIAQGRLPPITTKLTLYRDLPVADLEMTLSNKVADPWPEAGWLCLPLNVANAQFRLGRLGSIIDPVQDIVPGANRHLLALNTGLAVMDDAGVGVGICAQDNPLVSLDEPGCWKYSRDFVPRRARVYVNLFNNQWTTNFRLWNSGTWTARVRLWAFTGYNNASNLLTPSMETRVPLLAQEASGPAGALPTRQRGVEVSRPGVLVTDFGLEDGQTVLRVWEQAGGSGDCPVQLPAALQAVQAQPIDLRGSALGPAVSITNNALLVKLQPYGPATFRLVTKGR
jgi:hypothetical protein